MGRVSSGQPTWMTVCNDTKRLRVPSSNEACLTIYSSAEEDHDVIPEDGPDGDHGQREEGHADDPLPHALGHELHARYHTCYRVIMRPFLFVAMLLAPAAANAAKYYVVVRGVDEAKGVQSGVVPE